MSEKYAVVVFCEDFAEEVALVPVKWMVDKETKCWWPPFKSASKVTKATQEMWEPDNTWNLYPIRVLGKCHDYATGRSKAKRAEEVSDIQSEGEYGRGHKRFKRVRIDSDSSDTSDVSVVKEKKSKHGNLPQPPSMQDLGLDYPENGLCEESDHTNQPGSSCVQAEKDQGIASKGHVATMLDKALRPLLIGQAKCETRLEQTQATLNEMMTLIKNIKKQQGKTSVEATPPDTSVLDEFLPLNSYTDVTSFEEKLARDSDLKLSLERRLHNLGGTTIKSAVKYMIDYCLARGLQNQFNWEGRLGWKTKNNETKKGFKNNLLSKIMINILLNKPSLNADEAEIRKSIMTYLRNAGDRCYGRKRRSDPSIEDPQ